MSIDTLDRLGLSVTIETSKHDCVATVHDEATGHIWPRVPLLVPEVYDRTVQRVERLRTGLHYVVERVGEALHVTVSDRRRAICIGVWITITAQRELSVVLPVAEVYEDPHGLHRLFALDLLPGFMRADAGGQLFLPLHTGAICCPAGKPACADRFLIYGEQHCWELLPTMPLAGAQMHDAGLVAIAVRGAAETECRVSCDGRGSGMVGLSFFLRGRDVDPIETTTREIRFCPLPRGQDLVLFAASVLREHVMRDLGKRTLIERAKESPDVAGLLNAYIMKLFYGVQAQGSMLAERSAPSTPEFLLTMTFEEAGRGLKAFHDAGVDRIYTQNVGWNFRGHDGAYPTRFPVEQRVGAEEGFRALIAYGHQLGYQMAVHDNYVDAYESSPDFDPELVMADCYGRPLVRGSWGGGTSYLIWGNAYDTRRLEEQMRRVRALGVRGPYYLDGMGSPLYVNYHPRHRGSRTAMAAGIDRILRAGREVFGSSATETGYLYCCITPDLVANPGGESLLRSANPAWAVVGLIDHLVPVWRIAMSGLVVTENQGLSWRDTMKALLYNQHPRYEWSMRPGVQPVLDKEMIRAIKFRYDLLIGKFGRLRTQRITGYTRDGRVESTVFEDGTCIIGDFASNELMVNGQPIQRPPQRGQLADARYVGELPVRASVAQ